MSTAFAHAGSAAGSRKPCAFAQQRSGPLDHRSWPEVVSRPSPIGFELPSLGKIGGSRPLARRIYALRAPYALHSRAGRLFRHPAHQRRFGRLPFRKAGLRATSRTCDSPLCELSLEACSQTWFGIDLVDGQQCGAPGDALNGFRHGLGCGSITVDSTSSSLCAHVVSKTCHAHHTRCRAHLCTAKSHAQDLQRTGSTSGSPRNRAFESLCIQRECLLHCHLGCMSVAVLERCSRKA